MVFGTIQHWLFVVIAVGSFAFEAWALIDALSRPRGTYRSADKQTKALWVGILLGALAIGFLGLPSPVGFAVTNALGLLGIAAFAAAMIYAVGVRPALRAIRRSPRRARERRGGW
jgi:hypothetical protein